MGLAASQARLLTITHRIISDEHDLMKLSTQKFRLRSEGEELSSKYDWMINQTSLSYNGADVFSYDAIMGDTAIANGNNPTFITDKNGKVVLDGRLSKAIEAAYKAMGTSNDTTKGFQAFMTSVTGKDINWDEALNGKLVTVQTPISSNQPTQQGKDKENIPTIADYGSLLNEIGTRCGDRPNNQDYVAYQNWINTAQSIMKQRAQLEGKDYNFTVVMRFFDTHNLQTAYQDAHGSQRPQNESLQGSDFGSTGYTTTTKREKVDKNSEEYKQANFYKKIFDKVIKSGYKTDNNLYQSGYLKAQFENNTYRINGKLISEDDNAQQVKLSDSQKQDIRDWYEREKEKISYQEEDIELKSTRIQAELTALNTEKQSVQSIIDKNIERSFTYLTTG